MGEIIIKMQGIEIVNFLICFVIIATLDFGYIFCMIKSWVKQKELFNDFPWWKGTRKHIVWTLCWCILKSLDMVVYVVLATIIGGSKFYWFLMMTAFMLDILVVGLYWFIKSIVKNILQEKDENTKN